MRTSWAVPFLAVMTLYPVTVLADSATEAAKPDPDKLTVDFGGFIDSYYGYDFNNPQLLDRAFTTQPARHNEFNINLAYLDARISADRVRGRLALQAGTSVQANYAGEATTGSISGPTLARHLQEAFAGYRVNNRLWIDAGVFLSHIGLESWVSKENWTYTRSLVADFSPYFETGVKATYEWNDKLTTQLLVLNGWQSISENNGSKSLGLQIALNPTDRLALTYNNLLGNEAGSRRRFFNDFIGKLTLTDKFAVAASYDVGWQQSVDKTANTLWQGYAIFAHYQVAPKFALTLRGEQYFDGNQVLVTTNTANGFQTTSASLNADLTLHKNVMWRNEVRGYWSRDPVFPSKNHGLTASDGVAVTSLSLWF